MSTKSERMKAIHGVKVTCECGIQVARWSMSKHLETKIHLSKISGVIIPRQERFDKQSIEQRREKERVKNEKYRNETKEENSKKVTCECGAEVAKWSLSKHLESNEHISKISGEIISRKERSDKQPIEQRREKERERSAKYRNENEDKCREYDREYRLKNKEELCKKIQCECGELSTKSSLNRHRKSKKHNERLQKQQLND